MRLDIGVCVWEVMMCDWFSGGVRRMDERERVFVAYAVYWKKTI
jgi:hypothetical protein